MGMDQLAPHHVPVYETSDQRHDLWDRCEDRGQPVVAIRDARRGFIVRYDLQHLDVELRQESVQNLRDRTREWRAYPPKTDPVSETEGVGGEAGPVSGDLHADTQDDARQLASRLSGILFDRRNWI